MKKSIVIAAVFCVAVLGSCSDGGKNVTTINTDVTTTAEDTAVKTTAESTTTPATTEEVTSVEEWHTALEPPALRIEDLPNPVGIRTNFTDKDGNIVQTFVNDYGIDGRTHTYNCFDGNGDLMTWRSYEYDSKGQEVRYITHDADSNIISCEEYEYYDNGNKKLESHFSADGTTEYIKEYYEDGTQCKYTAYHTNGNIRIYEEYDNSGLCTLTNNYGEDGKLWSVTQYNDDRSRTETYYREDGTIVYEYDADGNETHYTFCSPDGEVIEER